MIRPTQSDIISSKKNNEDLDKNVMTTTKAISLVDNIMSIVFASILIPLTIFAIWIFIFDLVLPFVYALILGITFGAYCSSKYFEYALRSLKK